jgi:K+-sensing histidine kinase KdpD
MQTAGDEADAARALEEVNEIRRRVVNVVGHALRTPVTTLCGMAEALAWVEDADTKALLVEGVTRNARLVEALLDDLLVAAGVSTALPVGEPKHSRVDEAASRAWKRADHEATFTFDGAGVTAFVRSQALDRILDLVLDNAARYGDGTVVGRATTEGDVVIIEIAAAGGGVSDIELEQAFELFYRGEHAVMIAAGLGIGLPVVRVLVTNEGGQASIARRGDAIVTRLELPA